MIKSLSSCSYSLLLNFWSHVIVLTPPSAVREGKVCCKHMQPDLRCGLVGVVEGRTQALAMDLSLARRGMPGVRGRWKRKAGTMRPRMLTRMAGAASFALRQKSAPQRRTKPGSRSTHSAPTSAANPSAVHSSPLQYTHTHSRTESSQRSAALLLVC